MPNNESTESFSITFNRQEITSFPAAPDGIYNEVPQFDDMIKDNLTSGTVATIDNFAQIELLSAELIPQFSIRYPNDAWIILLKIKNLYGASLNFGMRGGGK